MDDTIEWDRLDQPTFDRIVEALYSRLYGEQAQALDGRGGDGGRDIDITDGGKLDCIAQLKYFPEGFSGGFRETRHRQIKKSFDAAMKWHPRVWRLVVPHNPTVNEASWVNNLGHDTGAIVELWGRQQLDSEIARFPDLMGYFNRDRVKEYLAQAQHEKDALAGPADLTQRQAALQTLADTRDPDWAVDEAVIGNVIWQIPRAKHPNAEKVSPFTVTYALRIPEERADLVDGLAQAKDFGVTEPLVIPGEYVVQSSTSKPHLLDLSGTPVQLSLLPWPNQVASQATPVQIASIGSFGEIRHSINGRVTKVSSGVSGMRLVMELEGGLTIRLLVPLIPASSGVQNSVTTQTNTTFAPVGCTARTVQAAATFLRDLLGGSSMRLTIDGKPLAQKITSEHEDTTVFSPVEQELVDDLVVISDHLHNEFVYPDIATLTMHQRVIIRVARMLFEGKCVHMPDTSTIVLTLVNVEGDNQDGRAKLQNLLNRGPEAYQYYGYNEPLLLNILGAKYSLGRYSWHHPTMVIDNADATRSAFDCGDETIQLTMKSTTTENVRIWLTDDGIDPPRVVTPEPWNLKGITEPGVPVGR